MPVTSRENPSVKRLCALLTQKKERARTRRFVLEGARLCLDAFEYGLTPEILYITEDATQRNPALTVLEEAAGDTIRLDRKLADRIADTETTQGVFCVFAQPDPLAGRVKPCRGGRYVLLHGVRDPGNLGAILRTAAALGSEGAVLSDCAELYSPKTLRASMGGVWRMPVSVLPEPRGFILELRQAGVPVFAAALKPDFAPTKSLRSPHGAAVVIGNEGTGLPDSVISACDGCVMIPMAGGFDSLNAAVAAGILIWEMLKPEPDSIPIHDAISP